MPKNVTIEALDDYGRGIARLDKKVIFIEDALPGEIVDIDIIKDKKSFSEGSVSKYLVKSNKRVKSLCPYFKECGGCSLFSLAYEDTLKFKATKIQNLLKKNKINYDKEIEIIKNDNPLYYRNKISLKIENGRIGYYKEKTHRLVEIKECMIASRPINEAIKNYKLLNLKDASLTIRANSNDEVLLIIESKEKEYNIELAKLKEKIKLVGIVYNDITIYGDNFFYERIGGFLFKVSYNSFFQVNHNINEKLFNLLNQYIQDDIVLDLYSGVGTLGIVASQKAQEVYSIEVIKNAVLNGVTNAKLNKVDNIKFMLGDVAKLVDNIDIDFTTLILDPPRKGLDKKTRAFIFKRLPTKIIYVSCDPHTLMRDLKELEPKYEIKEFKIMDMFSFTYHVECCTLLSLKETEKSQ